MDMATDTLLSNTKKETTTASHTPNLRNPLPLSAAQEGEVKDLYYARVRGHCAQQIKEFAECARGKTITATWICRDQRLTMQSCMIGRATLAEEDAARAEWFSKRDERKAKREEQAAGVIRRRQEIIDMMKTHEEKERLANPEGSSHQ